MDGEMEERKPRYQIGVDWNSPYYAIFLGHVIYKAGDSVRAVPVVIPIDLYTILKNLGFYLLLWADMPRGLSAEQLRRLQEGLMDEETVLDVVFNKIYATIEKEGFYSRSKRLNYPNKDYARNRIDYLWGKMREEGFKSYTEEELKEVNNILRYFSPQLSLDDSPHLLFKRQSLVGDTWERYQKTPEYREYKKKYMRKRRKRGLKPLDK